MNDVSQLCSPRIFCPVPWRLMNFMRHSSHGEPHTGPLPAPRGRKSTLQLFDSIRLDRTHEKWGGRTIFTWGGRVEHLWL